MLKKFLDNAVMTLAYAAVAVFTLLVMAAMVGGIVFFCRYIFGW